MTSNGILGPEASLWTVSAVQEWLDKEGLGDHTYTFQKNGVDGKALLALTRSDIKNTLGIPHLSERKAIAAALDKLRKSQGTEESCTPRGAKASGFQAAPHPPSPHSPHARINAALSFSTTDTIGNSTSSLEDIGTSSRSTDSVRSFEAPLPLDSEMDTTVLRELIKSLEKCDGPVFGTHSPLNKPRNTCSPQKFSPREPTTLASIPQTRSLNAHAKAFSTSVLPSSSNVSRPPPPQNPAAVSPRNARSMYGISSTLPVPSAPTVDLAALGLRSVPSAFGSMAEQKKEMDFLERELERERLSLKDRSPNVRSMSEQDPGVTLPRGSPVEPVSSRSSRASMKGVQKLLEEAKQQEFERLQKVAHAQRRRSEEKYQELERQSRETEERQRRERSLREQREREQQERELQEKEQVRARESMAQLQRAMEARERVEHRERELQAQRAHDEQEVKVRADRMREAREARVQELRERAEQERRMREERVEVERCAREARVQEVRERAEQERRMREEREEVERRACEARAQEKALADERARQLRMEAQLRAAQEQERAEQERQKREQRERERLARAAERAQHEREAAAREEQAARRRAEREAERERERLERERQVREAERLAQERLEKEQAEREQIEKEVWKERARQERMKAEQKAEQERLWAANREKERLEMEAIERERKQRAEERVLQMQQLAAREEQAARRKAEREAERERERQEQLRLQRERQEREERQRLEAERQEKAEQERHVQERAKQERQQLELEIEQLMREKDEREQAVQRAMQYPMELMPPGSPKRSGWQDENHKAREDARRAMAAPTVTRRASMLTANRGPILIAPQDTNDAGKPVVVLDLDETLVHCMRWPGPIARRPYTDQLLEFLGQHCEVVVWTAGIRTYAQSVVRMIDKTGVISHCVYRHLKWYTDVDYTKDLTLLGRNMDQTLIIENTPDCVSKNPKNGIIVPDYSQLNTGDQALRDLLGIMQDLIQHLKTPGASVPQFVENCPKLEKRQATNMSGDTLMCFCLPGMALGPAF